MYCIDMNNVSAEVLAMSIPVVGEIPTHFDRPVLALGGMAVAGAAVIATQLKNRSLDQQADIEVSQYPDPDMAEQTKVQYNKQRLITKVGGGLMAVAAGATLLNMADPSTVETNYNADKVSIIVEAGLDSRAKDVEDSTNGSEVTRMTAGINSGLRFADDLGRDVEVQFIFAGAPARSLGSVEGTVGSADVVNKADDYTRDLSTASAPDISGALGVADANEADQTVLITSDSAAGTADAINAFAKPISVITPGQPDTKFKFLGNEQVADYAATFGEIEAEQVQTTDEIQAVMDEISSSKIVSTKETPSKLFEKLRNISGLALGFGAGITLLKPLKKRKS